MSCEEYVHFSKWSAYLSIGLVVGIIVSYVPQQLNIARLQSTDGISPYFLLLMNLSAGCMLGNIVINSKDVILCCYATLTPAQCANSLMGMAQIAAAFVGPALVLLLAVMYSVPEPHAHKLLQRSAQLVTASDVGVLLLVLVAELCPAHSRLIGNFLGLVGIVLGCLQYYPQLKTTYELKHTGSLSVLALLMQTPGGFLWGLTLALRTGAVWSTWAPVVFCAFLQSGLLLMASYYYIRDSPWILDKFNGPGSGRVSLPTDDEAAAA